MDRWHFIAALFVSIILLSSLAGCTSTAPPPLPPFTATVLSSTSTSTLATTVTPERKDRIQLWEKGYRYVLGINHPWLNYGHDSGTSAWGHDGISSAKNTSTIEVDFADLPGGRPEFDIHGAKKSV